MLTIIKEILETGIAAVTALLSGALPRHLYMWCIGIGLFIPVFSYWEVRKNGWNAGAYAKSLLQEIAGHILLWVAGIVIARFFSGIIDHGVSSAEDHTFYTLGFIMLIAYDLSVIFSIGWHAWISSDGPGQISAFVFGSLSAYFIYWIAEEHFFYELVLSTPYRTVLSLVTGAFVLLYVTGQYKWKDPT